LIHQAKMQSFSVEIDPIEAGRSKKTLSEDNEVYPVDLSGDEGNPSEDTRDDSGKSSFFDVIVGIINTAVGPGLLGLPYVVRQLGILCGGLVILMGAVLLYICSDLLQRSKNLSRHSNYVTIAQFCFKGKGYVLLAVTLIINNFGSCVIFLSIFASVAQNLFVTYDPACSNRAFTPFYCEKSVLIALGGLLILPFNFMKSLEKLAVINICKICCITVFTIITFGFFLYSLFKGTLAKDVNFLPTFEDPISIIACIPQVILAYNFLFNQFSIYKSMKKPSDTNMRIAVISGMFITAILFLIISMSGYSIFGSSTDNILRNFTLQELGSPLFLLLNVSFMTFALMTFPPTYFSPRNIIYQNLRSRFVGQSYALLGSPGLEKSQAAAIDDNPKAKLVFNLTVCVTNFLIISFSIMAPNINELFGLIGSLATDTLIFLFPAAFYLKLSSKNGKKRSRAKTIFILGLILGFFGFSANVLKIISD